MYLKKMLKIIAISLLAISFNGAADANKKVTKDAQLFTGIDTQAAKVVQRFHMALQTGDRKLARSLLSDDVLIFEGGGVERSAEEYAHHHMLADMKYLKALQVKTIEHHVKVYDDVAVSYSRSHSKGSYKGKKVDRNGMETITLRKINQQWKITHIHWS